MRYLTQIKPIINRVDEVKLPPRNVLLITLSEVGNDLGYFYLDKIGYVGPFMVFIPMKLYRYVGSKYISKMKLDKEAPRFSISPSILKTKRTTVIDISIYLEILRRRGYRIINSKKYLNAFKEIILSLFNIKGVAGFKKRYFHLIIDVDKSPYIKHGVSKALLRTTYLGLFYYMLKNKKMREWFDKISGKLLITLLSSSSGNALTMLAYDSSYMSHNEDEKISNKEALEISGISDLVGRKKLSVDQIFTRIFLLIRKFIRDSKLEEEVENKVEKAVKTVISKNEKLKKHENIIKKVVKNFADKYPDEVVTTKNPESEKEALKLVGQASKYELGGDIDEIKTSEDVKKTMSLLIKTKIEPVTPPEKMTKDDIINKIKPVKPEVGNITNLKKISLTSKFQDYVKLFNYYLERKGFKILSVEKIHEDSKDIADTELDLYLMKVKDYKNRIWEIKFQLPKLIDGNFFIYRGVKRVFTYQLFPLPVTSFKSYETTIRTNFADLTVSVEMKFKRRTFFAKILGRKIPTVWVFIAYYGNIKTFLDKFKIKYELSDKPNKKADAFIKIKDKFLNMYTNEDEKKLLLKGLYYYDVQINEDTQKEWLEFIAKRTTSKFAVSLNDYFEQFIDPITYYILYIENMPTKFDDLLWYACLEAYTGRTVRQTDLRHRRVRSSEILAVMLFKRLYLSIFEFLQKERMSGGKSKTGLKLSIPIDALLSDLTLTDAQSQYQKVNNINPLVDASYSLRVSYSGYGGIKSEFVPMSMRNVDPTYFGVIDPVDTPESKNAGAVQHFTPNADVINLAGKFKLKPPKSNENIFSVPVALSPFATANDTARNLMAASQQRHAMPLKHAQLPMIMSGYENLPALLCSSDYAFRAEEDGEVLYVDDNYIVIKYKNGLVKNISLKPRAGDLNVAFEYRQLVKPGDKVKKNQLLAENKYFFKNGTYTYGINAYVALMPYAGFNFEDGIVISESFAKKLSVTQHVEEKVVVLSNEFRIDDIILEPGEIEAGKPLISIIASSSELLGDDEDVPDEIVIGHKKQVVYPYSVNLLDIEIYASDRHILERFPMLKDYLNNQIKKYREVLLQFKKYGVPDSGIDKKIKLLSDPFGVKYKGRKLKDEVVIVFKISYERPTYLGDKFANRHGNKGVVGRILPDELMPEDPNGKKFDMVINPLGIVSRKNPGQLMELYLTRASKVALDKLQEIFAKKGIKQAKAFLIQFYETLYERLKDIKQQMVSNVKNMSDKDFGEFIKMCQDSNGILIYSPPVAGLNINDVLKLYKYLKINTKDYLYVPEFKSKTKKKIPYGYMYWIKQEQLVETKMSARSTGPYTSKTLQPTAGRAAEGGQRLGELDVWALSAYGVKHTIKELMTVLSDDFDAKSRLINSIIRNGDASMDEIEKFKPESARMLKIYLAGMMISEDLSFIDDLKEELERDIRYRTAFKSSKEGVTKNTKNKNNLKDILVPIGKNKFIRY